jgi:hypothetical protein
VKRALLALTLLVAPALRSQSAIGLRFGTDFDANGKDLTRNIVGAVVTRSLSTHWQMAASVTVYPSVSDGAIWASADLRFRPPLAASVLYFATGVTEADHGAAKNNTGADLAFGLDPRIGSAFRPFAEGKWVVYRWYTSFTVQGGLAVRL